MHDTDRSSLLADLRQTRETLFAALDGVSETQAAWKPADQWSILDCVEHVAITERGMLRMVQEACVPAPPDRAPKEHSIRDLAADRTRKLVAPATALPTGRYPTLQLAAQRFGEARGRTVEYVEQCQGGLRAQLVNHPAAGMITAHECLVLLIGHSARHTAQIREIRRHSAYPQVAG